MCEEDECVVSVLEGFVDLQLVEVEVRSLQGDGLLNVRRDDTAFGLGRAG